MKNKICFEPITNSRGTVVSNALYDHKGQRTFCNVIWDDGQHSTEKIKNLVITDEINPEPPKW